jgi:hypothetical protein
MSAPPPPPSAFALANISEDQERLDAAKEVQDALDAMRRASDVCLQC